MVTSLSFPLIPPATGGLAQATKKCINNMPITNLLTFFIIFIIISSRKVAILKKP
jgi:hypothetical protein